MEEEFAYLRRIVTPTPIPAWTVTPTLTLFVTLPSPSTNALMNPGSPASVPIFTFKPSNWVPQSAEMALPDCLARVSSVHPDPSRRSVTSPTEREERLARNARSSSWEPHGPRVKRPDWNPKRGQRWDSE